KVVGGSPDFSEYEKFADIWLPAKPGTDAALAMAMTHVILKEFYVDRQIPYFIGYAKQYTDLPHLVQITTAEDGGLRSDAFLRASDISDDYKLGEWKTVIWDEHTNQPAVPLGSSGYRWDESGQWNLDLEDENGNEIDPR